MWYNKGISMKAVQWFIKINYIEVPKLKIYRDEKDGQEKGRIKNARMQVYRNFKNV